MLSCDVGSQAQGFGNKIINEVFYRFEWSEVGVIATNQNLASGAFEAKCLFVPRSVSTKIEGARIIDKTVLRRKWYRSKQLPASACENVHLPYRRARHASISLAWQPAIEIALWNSLEDPDKLTVRTRSAKIKTVCRRS